MKTPSNIAEKYVSSGNKDTRSGFGAGLLEIGKENENIVALCADLTGSVKMTDFAGAFPGRFFQCGIAEANMVSTAAGMTVGGKIPFIGTFANFATGRIYDQIRQTVAYSKKNVKIAASHAGLTLGEDGATHQMMEDIGLMKMLPNMTVIVPADYNQTKAATIAAAEHYGPVYLRFGRPKVPVFTPEIQKFTIGRAMLLQEGTDVSIFATGHLVWSSLQAAILLAEKGISAEVFNIHTIKPLDEEGILKAAEGMPFILTVEDHYPEGGLGETVASAIGQKVKVFSQAVTKLPHSGKSDELLAEQGLDARGIADRIRKLVESENKQTVT